MGWGCEPHAQPPTWRTSVFLLVWVIIFDLSGMEAIPVAMGGGEVSGP